MIRGTTPTFEFTLPFSTDLLAEGYITFAQGSHNVIEKELSECTCEGERITLRLSQADTLKFNSGRKVEIQMRVKTLDGEALASEMIETTVDRILKDGEI